MSGALSRNVLNPKSVNGLKTVHKSVVYSVQGQTSEEGDGCAEIESRAAIVVVTIVARRWSVSFPCPSVVLFQSFCVQ